ncbi:MAG TPA: alpha/beta hydrolase [Amnibacterium sp.]|jgi:pimeloyl-ACP methyl ester carboxylesterase|uniref:alpha/beta fold hydrolase n=1 Tax=Amnibacterium sp. TaxID=1872496 RepID=UPI002F926CC0
MFETRTIVLDDATIVYDVRGPEPVPDQKPLLLIGQPMDASGFTALADRFPDRAVVTYDPRGLGRSTRRDGGVDADPDVQGADLHRIIGALDVGPVDVFASSGGAVAAFALVAAHPNDVATLVAHEPPLASVLPDEDAVHRAFADVVAEYQARGWSAGMARFLAMNMWQGELTADYFERPAPSPSEFGFADVDDGRRDDPLFSGSAAVMAFRPDVAALLAAPTRVVIAVGEESAGTFTARTSEAMAALLGQRAVVFPSHHGGFVGGDGPYAGRPAAFAERLRSMLDPSQ